MKQRLWQPGAMLVTILLITAQTVTAANLGVIGITAGPVVNGRSASAFHYQLAAGQTVNDTVKVINTSEQAEVLSLATESAVIGPDNSFGCQAATATDTTGTAQWLKLAQTSVTIAAGTVTLVPLTIKVPPQAVAGEHNACLTATRVTPVTATAKPKQTAIDLQTRVALRLSIVIPGDLRLSLQAATPKITMTQKTVTVTRKLTNQSPVSLIAKTTVTMSHNWPKLGSSSQTAELLILPEAYATTNLPNFQRPFWGGWYTVTAITSYNMAANDISRTPGQTVEAFQVSRFIWPSLKAMGLVAGCLGLSATLWRWGRQRKRRQIYKIYRH